MELTIRSLTPEVWPALEDLFRDSGTCTRCWCMYWRIGPTYRKNAGDANRRALSDIVMKGPPPGLLAFVGDLPVGWCQLTPRDALPHLESSWRLRRVDDLPVWCISCFYVRKSYRRRGVTTALIAEALKVAKQAGAPALEAYPLDGRLSPSSTSTGYASTFARAGFSVVARHAPPRPIMRYDLRQDAASGSPIVSLPKRRARPVPTPTQAETQHAKPTTIDEYLTRVPEAQREALDRLRQLIRKTAPEAVECISYGLPAFRLHGRPLVAFGAAARHCSFYPMSAKTIEDHRAELSRFSTSKGAIRFQPDAPLPAALVRKLVRSRIAENEASR